MKVVVFFVVLVCMFIVGFYYFGTSLQPEIVSTDGSFRTIELSVQSYDLNDLGVVDANDDGYLDIFTTNHSALQSLMLNDGGSFGRDSFIDSGMAQSRDFPGVEDQFTEVKPEQPGLYIFRYQRWLVFQAHDIDAEHPVELKLEVPWKIETRSRSDAVMEARLTATDSMLKARLENDQRLEVNGVFDIAELVHSIQIENDFPLANIFIGSEKLRPESPRFLLMWRDRHAMAWSDINSDGMKDVYITRGGVKGSIASLEHPVNDELFLQQPGLIFTDDYKAFGFRKSICPGRQTTWVDANGDGRLDLHIVCGRNGRNVFRDQLWIRKADGTFDDVAETVGLDNAHFSVGIWFDVDHDGDQDYLSQQGRQLVMYDNDKGSRFRRNVLGNFSGDIVKFTLADIDSDGDVDGYAAGREQSLLLINEGGRLVVTSAQALGLPTKAETANWVDFDNDGFVDLHVIPDGLFRHLPSGNFVKMGSMNYRQKRNRLKEIRCSWFDSDNDGDMDCVCAHTFNSNLPSHHWQTKVLGRRSTQKGLAFLFENEIFNGNNNWLQVKLQGYSGNIEAIGARVTIYAGGRAQSGLVGGWEGSHYGQGHYRIYFGLGDKEIVDRIIVALAGWHSQDH